MKKILFISLVLFCFVSSVSYSQKVGKIFPGTSADSLFGKVVETVSITKDNLNSLLTQTDNYIMFKISNGELIILGDGRKVLFPADKIVNDKDVFHMYSKSKVITLLDISDVDSLKMEEREKAFTVSYDWVILEFSQPCPPVCW